MRKLVFGESILLIIVLVAWGGCTIRKVSRPEQLYRSRCSGCHRLIPKEELSLEGWRYALERYGEKLTGEEKEAILKYLGGEE